MGELKLWTDGEDLYAATSAEEAGVIREKMCGVKVEEDGPLELATEPLQMVVDEETRRKETRPHSEWIQMVTQGAPGWVASTNW